MTHARRSPRRSPATGRPTSRTTPIRRRPIHAAFESDGSGPGDLPVQIRYRRQELRHHDGGAVHQPGKILPVRRVSPDEVGAAVAVNIANRLDLPVEVGNPRPSDGTENRGAVHQPEDSAAGHTVAP